MYHDLFRNASFWSFLFSVDQESRRGHAQDRDARAAGDCTVPTTLASHAVDARICRNPTATA